MSKTNKPSFIVLNIKHIGKPTDDPELDKAVKDEFYSALDTLTDHFNVPDHQYLVVNRDEPYSQKVWDLIEEEEFRKNKGIPSEEEG